MSANQRIALRSRDLYTVGVVCALAIERAAVRAVLDAQHARPLDFTQGAADPNSYEWGNIGAHNVVIASLPNGRYGTDSAASVAATMLTSFPGVRFGLMVGIGAAIPQNGVDIRLGDVAVSTPKGQSGGVVQYDFIKAIQGGNLERIGHLNAPPAVLNRATAHLKSVHDLQPSHMPQILARMPPAFHHPGLHLDQIQTPQRNSTDPHIHYAVIASRNTLIKDAKVRADLVKRTGEDCICFEMEAAGLMNTFPCLVIRGLCDYADEDKNKDWQRYAAAVAAAYTKELLEYVQAQTALPSTPAPVTAVNINCIRVVSATAIRFTDSSGFLAVNGNIPRNTKGQACPWDQCSSDSAVEPQTTGLLPDFLAYAPIIGFYGAGMFTVWDGFDQEYIRQFRRLSDVAFNSTHIVQAFSRPCMIDQDSKGRPFLRPTGQVWQGI